MKMILFASMALSMVFMQSSHPAMLMILILCQTLVVCILVWASISTSWFSFIMFLIFVGGLMVLFVYIVSLAANEMFNLNVKITSMFFSFILISSLAVISLNSQFKTSNFTQSLNSILMVYSESMMLITSSTMVYLLLTLVVVVKLASKYEGPLRNTIF